MLRVRPALGRLPAADEREPVALLTHAFWRERWAEAPDAAQRVAIRAHAATGKPALTFAELQREANAMSNLLRRLGVQRGDRVAIVMPQRFETAVAYMAVFQLGAVAMPLSMLFGPEALEYRLQDSEAVVAICDESSIVNVLQVRAQCPALRTLVGVAGAASCLSWVKTAAAGYRSEIPNTSGGGPVGGIPVAAIAAKKASHRWLMRRSLSCPTCATPSSSRPVVSPRTRTCYSVTTRMPCGPASRSSLSPRRVVAVTTCFSASRSVPRSPVTAGD